MFTADEGLIFVLFFKPDFHGDRECYRIYGSEM